MVNCIPASACGFWLLNTIGKEASSSLVASKSFWRGESATLSRWTEKKTIPEISATMPISKPATEALLGKVYRSKRRPNSLAEAKRDRFRNRFGLEVRSFFVTSVSIRPFVLSRRHLRLHLDCNLLFRWFGGLEMEDAAWGAEGVLEESG
jgi:hypothetical protein